MPSDQIFYLNDPLGYPDYRIKLPFFQKSAAQATRTTITRATVAQKGAEVFAMLKMTFQLGRDVSKCAHLYLKSGL